MGDTEVCSFGGVSRSGVDAWWLFLSFRVGSPEVAKSRCLHTSAMPA